MSICTGEVRRDIELVARFTNRTAEIDQSGARKIADNACIAVATDVAHQQSTVGRDTDICGCNQAVCSVQSGSVAHIQRPGGDQRIAEADSSRIEIDQLPICYTRTDQVKTSRTVQVERVHKTVRSSKIVATIQRGNPGERGRARKQDVRRIATVAETNGSCDDGAICNVQNAITQIVGDGISRRCGNIRCRRKIYDR